MDLRYLLVITALGALYILFLTSYLHEARVVYHNARTVLHPYPHRNATHRLRPDASSYSHSQSADTTSTHLHPTHRTLNMPRIIHQTWKTTELPQWALSQVDSWKRLNPTWEYRLWDDAAAEQLIRTDYPSLWPIWQLHLHAVQRADVFRYAVVHKFGGVYADIDVACVLPIDQWVHPMHTNDFFNVDMIVGWEALPSAKEVALKHFASEYQLCQWTFAAVPGHWLLARVLQDVEAYYARGEHERSMSIIRSTGPGMFSTSMRESIRLTYKNVTFGSGHGLEKQAMKHTVTHIGGLYIFPLVAFGSRGSRDFDVSLYASASTKMTLQEQQQFQQKRLVIHGFQGSWKEEHKIRKSEKKKKKKKKEQEQKRKEREV